MLLRDLDWKIRYSPADGDLLQKFYVPVLRCALRYDRTTGFYSAQTLVAAAKGVEELVRNGGKMRLIVGCTLGEDEVRAICRGEELKNTVEAKLLASPFAVEDEYERDSLEMLAWMVANDFLQIKVALPCSPHTRKPFAGGAIFHEKAGIIEDAAGDRLVFSGSLNETLAGWRSRNWDTFHVFRSWKDDVAHLEEVEMSFRRLWPDEEPTAIVLGIGEAVKKKLLEYLPADGELPKRLEAAEKEPEEKEEEIKAEAEIIADPLEETWKFIREAPAKEPGGEWVGLAAAAVVPWPHQEKAFRRMYEHWPPRLLIADEVGLGKTIQAGLLIRQAWLAGRATRILIMAPKAVLWQWQLELREKFNLNFPVYDDGKLHWHPSPALKNRHIRPVGNDDWHREPFLLVSSELMRRGERSRQLLEDGGDWDLVVLDEAHHARRKGGPGDIPRDVPNRLLRLMRKLEKKTAGLVLLTATPMQINPVEVWDLLNLLGLPGGWSAARFLEFFRQTAHPAPDNAMLANVAGLFREVEERYAKLGEDEAAGAAKEHGKFAVKEILGALRSEAATPRNMLRTEERRLFMKLARMHNPVKMLISRHARELLRNYRRAGQLSSNIATRQVEDIMVELSPAERALYETVEDYISCTYNKASEKTRSAVGFVMTIYRRRLASSFFALEQTLKSRYEALRDKKSHVRFSMEDMPADELGDDMMEEEEAAAAERRALEAEESGEIARLLGRIGELPTDTKVRKLFERVEALKAEGYDQVIVFTQYTDSLDFLRERLIAEKPDAAILCFSGRGGERWNNGEWEKISRDKTKEIFRKGQAEIMFCTDAAAEGLNFQFCGALINYDMPWNPMRVEQRIGRIDRLGQKYENIKIVNFMYADTVEADIYRALRERISLFGAFVGRLQPILARLPRKFEEIVLAGGDRSRQMDMALENMRAEIDGDNGFDLDEMSDCALELQDRPEPAYGLDYLEKILDDKLLPPGHDAAPLTRRKDYKYYPPGFAEAIRVTCDRDFYSAHAESVELWSPGSPAFPWEKT